MDEDDDDDNDDNTQPNKQTGRNNFYTDILVQTAVLFSIYGIPA